MGTIETQQETVTKLERIAWLSAQDPAKEFGCLMHHVNVESLQECYELLDGKKAVGIDGVTKEAYGMALLENLEALITRMKKMGYRPSPVKQVPQFGVYLIDFIGETVIFIKYSALHYGSSVFAEDP